MSFFSNFFKDQVHLKPLSLESYRTSLSLLAISTDQYTSTKEPLLFLSSATTLVGLGSVVLLSAVSRLSMSLIREAISRLVPRVPLFFGVEPAHSSAD